MLKINEVFKDDLAHLPEPVHALVQKSYRAVCGHLTQAAGGRAAELVFQKQSLRLKIDSAKKAYRELVDDMKGIQERITSSQKQLQCRFRKPRFDGPHRERDHAFAG